MIKWIVPYHTGGAGFGQLEFDSEDEVKACKFLVERSTYPLAEIHRIWFLVKKNNPKDTWEELLKRTAQLLVSSSSQAIYVDYPDKL